MVKTCPSCDKGRLQRVDDITSDFSGHVFVERGERCDRCGEEFIDSEDSERTIRALRKLGIWGKPLKLRRRLSRSGRGIILRIPRDLQESLNLKGTEEVLLSKVGKRRLMLEITGQSSARP